MINKLVYLEDLIINTPSSIKSQIYNYEINVEKDVDVLFVQIEKVNHQLTVLLSTKGLNLVVIDEIHTILTENQFRYCFKNLSDLRFCSATLPLLKMQFLIVKIKKKKKMRVN